MDMHLRTPGSLTPPSTPTVPAVPLRSGNRAGIPDPLRFAFSARAEARRFKMPVAELVGENAEAVRRVRAREAECQAEQPAVQTRDARARHVTRRRFVGAAGAAAGAALAGVVATPAHAAESATGSSSAARIVIVGGGLAGLRCAHKLWTGGPNPIAATLYEADTTHLGGRCWSLRGYFGGGQVHEHGGSFVSSTDTETLALAQRLGLSTEYANGGALDSGDYLAWINGSTYENYFEDFIAQVGDAVEAAASAVGTPRYDDYNAEAYRLDNMSMLDWLDEVGVRGDSQLGQMMQSLSMSSGGAPEDSSALTSILFSAGGGFDEKYHIAGGNDQLVSGMAAQLPPGAVQQGYELVALRRNHNGGYTCTFDNRGRLVSVPADHVVLALPFSMLRRVDLSGAGLSARKLTAIRQQGMGQNAKIVTQLTRKTWPAAGGNGVTTTGTCGYQSAWDGSVQLGGNGSPALLVGFPGGDVGRYRLTGSAHGPAPGGDVHWFLDQVENLYPGTYAAFNGRAYEDHWSRDPWHYGSYHYYKPGQYTSIAGYEGVQEGRAHFAGEHTNVTDSTLNAAVASGERAADEIAAQI
jgi:monoamine oxidase